MAKFRCGNCVKFQNNRNFEILLLQNLQQFPLLLNCYEQHILNTSQEFKDTNYLHLKIVKIQ